MSLARVQIFSNTLDGFGTGEGQSRDAPFGQAGETLHQWLLTTRWKNVGSYRRALSSYDVKLAAVPLLSRALDEPSAYEVVTPGGAGLNEAIPRGNGIDGHR